MNIRLFLTVLLLSGFTSILNAQQKGWFIIEQQEDRYGNASSQSVFIQGQQLRIENAASVFIIDLENEQLTLVFPVQQIFWKGSARQLREAILNSLKQQLEEMIARLPEHSRAEADSSFRSELKLLEADNSDSTLSVPLKIEKTNAFDTILGFVVQKHNIFLDSVLLETIWTSKEINPYSGINSALFREMTSIFRPPSRVQAHRETDLYQQFTRENMVMRSVIPTPVGESTTEIKQIKGVPIPGDFFRPPPDYKNARIEEVIAITMDQEAPFVTNGLKPEKTSPQNPSDEQQKIRPPY
ncbi:MAG: hypothetical protein PHP48_02805 [Bacteroidales bacterium]|nr:hypothetical protein [Bacteroidales bacterium]